MFYLEKKRDIKQQLYNNFFILLILNALSNFLSFLLHNFLKMGRESEEEIEKIKMTKKNKVHRKKSDTSVNEIEFKPVLDKHSCTDILCSLLFIIFIAILILVSVFAYTQGDPSSLINPRDSEGKICDSNKPNLFYFDLTRCLSVVSLAVGCPTKQILM